MYTEKIRKMNKNNNNDNKMVYYYSVVTVDIIISFLYKYNNILYYNIRSKKQLLYKILYRLSVILVRGFVRRCSRLVLPNRSFDGGDGRWWLALRHKCIFANTANAIYNVYIYYNMYMRKLIAAREVSLLRVCIATRPATDVHLA